ncbi:zinc finger protein 564-like [Paramacrobiotus metropolitanus]|uniref:zinc finger protein 564-like n=1 Tax=Paramacrobiotus metropolitanus TaxID=2943436 RepID=UPI002445A08D|nr:zinc finger protein 564-like [Paramacrobiotus metropolitanus]
MPFREKVLAKHSIPPQTIFGPLVAATAGIRKESTVYAFPSPEDGQLRFFQLDSELFSNWMRYVRFAENPAEENLAVYLRGSQVVFVSLRAIFPGEELKVGYSAKYARTVGSGNAQIDKHEFDDFCVRGLESVEHNENAYPQVETWSSVNTAGLDCDSLVPGNEENFLPDPPISASTLPGNPLPDSAVRTNLDDAPLVSLFELSCSDQMNKKHACEKTEPTLCTDAPDNLPTYQQRKRGQRRKMDTVNKEDGQEKLKQKRSRPGKEQVLERRGDTPSAAEHTEDYTNSSVHAPPLPTSHKANNFRVDTNGSAAKSIDVHPVQAKTVRENSPEIAYHAPVRKTASPSEEHHSAGAEIVCRRSTLRSAKKAAVPPVETLTVPGLDNCDPGDELELMGTGKGLGIDSDSDWAGEDGVVSDEDNDEQESDEDICDMDTDRKSRQSNGKCPRITKKEQSCINKVPNSNTNDSSPLQKGRPLSQRKPDEKECPVCHLVTSKLNQHLNREHPDNAARLLQHACTTCGMRYQSLERLRTHMTVSHPTRGEKPTAESRQAAMEYMQKTGRMPYFCVKCSRYFLSKPVLDIHERGCHRALEDDLERTERKCPACGFTGTSFGQLALHTANHAIKASERKQCLLCAEQIFVLQTHYQRNHPEYREIVPKDWQFECQQCGEKFLSQPNLDTHTRKHEKFQCIYCAVQLENTEAFTEHLSEHQKDGCFPCPVCPRIFPQYAEFREHYRCEHDAKSVLVCEVCQVVCRDRGRLKEHVQTHNKDYRFPCNQCRQRFHTERNLRRHVRKQHEGNLSNKPTGASRTRRQRECEECPVCHRAVQKLDAHLNRKHPEDADKYLQHACTTCGMRYHSAHSLHIHVTRFHPARGEEPTIESRQVAIELHAENRKAIVLLPTLQ